MAQERTDTLKQGQAVPDDVRTGDRRSACQRLVGAVAPDLGRAGGELADIGLLHADLLRLAARPHQLADEHAGVDEECVHIGLAQRIGHGDEASFDGESVAVELGAEPFDGFGVVMLLALGDECAHGVAELVVGALGQARTFDIDDDVVTEAELAAHRATCLRLAGQHDELGGTRLPGEPPLVPNAFRLPARGPANGRRQNSTSLREAAWCSAPRGRKLWA
ncbi:hypothetical protein C8D87_103568 [Lentzea atacamensis]|uniref:Uncharacterized protein n=1 Tax=Lentzea atacamensis TaxID=531938 RepID=A0ABX9EDH1_9PSEU|nr:hypothetical protein [Lentzea atacamensis]RAS67229.1 hypothetical protein C8D87_103568 [Lentzea atacamensis]